MIQQPPPTKHMVIGSMVDIIRTVDEHARELNRRWGFNRLPHIVPIEWTERFVTQKRKWELACFECAGSPTPDDLARVRKHGEAMLRAFDKLEEVALATGRSPTPPGSWEFELPNGTSVALVRERAELGQVERPSGGQVWCLEEIAEIVTRFPELLAAKDHFPDAEIIQLRTSTRTRELVDDELAGVPF